MPADRAPVVTPDFVVMQVSSSVSTGLFNADDPIFSWVISGEVALIITVDPAYSARFSLLQSDIPMVAGLTDPVGMLLLGSLAPLAFVLENRRSLA